MTAYTWDWYCHLVGDRASLSIDAALFGLTTESEENGKEATVNRALDGSTYPG